MQSTAPNNGYGEGLVRAGEDDGLGGRATGVDAGARTAGLVVGDAADGGAGLFFDALLVGAVTVPPADREACLDGCFELVVAGDGGGVIGTEFERALIKGVLDFGEQGDDALGQSILWDKALAVAAGDVAASHCNRAFFDVFGADFDAHGHALDFPFVELKASSEVFALVDFEADRTLPACGDALDGVHHEGFLGVVFVDGDDDDLDGGQSRRHNQAVVVAVGHDEGADEAGADAPAGGPGVLDGVGLVGERNIKCLGEVLAQVVGRAGLQGAAVLHHGFDAVGAQGAGELLAVGFEAAQDGQGHFFFDEVGIDVIEDHKRFGLGLGLGGMDGVAFLPEELGGAQERAGAHLPTHDVGPLVDQDGQVAVRANPFGVEVTDDGLGGGTDNVGLGELFAAGTGDLGDFGGKALDVLGFFGQKAFGDEQGKVRIDVTALFDAAVEAGLNAFPDGIAGRFEDDTAADDFGIVGQVGFTDDIEVPLRIVFGAGRYSVFGHDDVSFVTALGRHCTMWRFWATADYASRRAWRAAVERWRSPSARKNALPTTTSSTPAAATVAMVSRAMPPSTWI